MNAVLSMPVSYVYNNYLATTQSQILDVAQAKFYMGQGGYGWWCTSDFTSEIVSLGHVDPTGEGQNGEGVMFTARCDGKQIGTFPISPGGESNSHPLLTDDDGVSPLPSTYHPLREGIERFMITDINNPAGSAMAQSTIFVMWDAYSNGIDFLTVDQYNSGGGGGSGVGRFNHVPGGSNVLYMDGHTEFIKLNDKAPMMTKSHPNSMAAWDRFGAGGENTVLGTGGGFWMQVAGILGGQG
jgi:prepilin-type processing-associated H-X9-DG protein